MSNQVVNIDWQQIAPIQLGNHTDVFEVQTADHVRCAVQYFYLPAQLGQVATSESASDEPGQENGLTRLRDNIASLVNLQHDNLVRILDVKVLPQDHAVAMFFELVSEPLLEQLIRKRDAPAGSLRLPEHEIRLYSKQICGALKYLHDEKINIIHRNLDSANVIVVQEGSLVKLMNYGMSVRLMEGSSTHPTNCPRGRPHYLAPELFQETGEILYSRDSDIWALGCLVYEMAAGTRPYEACQSMEQIAAKVKKEGAPKLPSTCSFALTSFYIECTSKTCRHDRSSADRLLGHPFLDTQRST